MASDDGPRDDSVDVNKPIAVDYKPQLDFFSEQFDPLKALNCDNLQAPIPDAKVYDNVAKFESIYLGKQSTTTTTRKPDVEDVGEKSVPGCSSNVLQRFQEHQLPVRGKRKDISHKNILKRMELIEGPLKLLKKCKDDHIRIKVYTRHGYGVRGYLTGFVTAFDKYWNISLEDVYERWTRARKRKTPPFGEPATNGDLQSFETVATPSITVLQWDKRTETCERRVDQLLIRGAQIVIVVVNEQISR